MKKFLSLVLALIMVMSLVTVGAGAADFTDAEEIQYKEAVDVMAGLGILSGYNGAFDPQGTLSRQAAAKIIAYIALGVEDAEDLTCIEAPFTDVAADATLAPYVAWAAENGIINGYDDGTFLPKGNVSGHAFTKMVLGALGIEGEYTGDNWRYNVTIAAQKADLFEGIDTTAISLRDDATRELACQIAFNAMFYSEEETETQYIVYTDVYEEDGEDEGTEPDYVGTIVHYEGTDATAAALASVGNAGSVMEQYNVPTGAFAWDNFGLMVDEDGKGEFDRPATVYTSTMDEDVEVIVYKTPVATYENGATDKTIWTDLGYTKASDNITLNIVADGANESQETYKKGDTAATVGGKGAVVEVYKTSTSKTFDVVVINTYVDKLSDNQIVEAKDATSTADAVPAYIIVEGDADAEYEDDGTFETADFAEDDVILYTKDGAEIKTVVKAEKVENVKISKYVADTSVTIDGKAYSYSAQAEDVETSMSFTTAYTYYLDAQGNVIYRENYAEEETIVTDYAYITKIEAEAAVAEGDSLLDGATEAYAVAEVIFVDGSKEVVEIQIKKATSALSAGTAGAAVPKNGYYYNLPKADGTALRAVVADISGANELVTVGNWFAYEVNEDGTYTFSEVDDTYAKVSTTNVTADKGVVEKINADKLTTSKTVYTYIDNDGTVTTATGLVDMDMYASRNRVLYTYAKNGTTATAVYAVNQIVLGDETPDAVYAYAVEEGAVVADGTEWTFYIDGEEVTYILDDEAGEVAEDTVYTVTIEDGIVTNADAVATEGDLKVVTDATVTLVDETFFVINSTFYLTEDSEVYDIQDGVASAELAEDDVITMVIEKNTDTNAWELVIAYITDVAE